MFVGFDDRQTSFSCHFHPKIRIMAPVVCEGDAYLKITKQIQYEYHILGFESC